MIHIKSNEEIEKIRESCRVVVECLRLASEMVRPGLKLKELELSIENLIRSRGGKPAFKGYRGFPASACLSVDDVVVHGIPKKDDVLLDGQIIGVDVGVVKDAFYGDSAITLPVGDISPEKARLLKVTKQSLYEGIHQVKSGQRLHDVSAAVQKHVEGNGFSIVRDLVGHGIGRELHEEPQVPNFGKAGTGPRMKAGMVFCIEPMVNAGTFEVYTKEDRWTICTRDGRPSAHFEHTVAVTDNGPEILTQSDLF
ncbi:MAG: type I methionyl aminopeptidase [Bacteroidetes bacterium]|nr:type I methionyl aminopeptidase [Bacteroidota bacterium]